MAIVSQAAGPDPAAPLIAATSRPAPRPPAARHPDARADGLAPLPEPS